MSSRELEDLAEDARDALGDVPVHGETWREQLGKACHLLTDASALARGVDKQPSRATTVVELSLVVIERTLQAVLMRDEDFDADEFQHHLFAIQTAGERGVISTGLAQSLEQIWREHRNENYYRAGLPTAEAATKTLRLATGLHGQLMRRSAAFRGACTCRRPRR